MASLVGMEEATTQTVHARYAWKSGEILFGYRFVDIVVQLPDGRRALDYARFDHVEPIAAPG
ncbi:MAG: hypothetical protein M3O36_15220 [Myxococcota bacterium]|nr:hypothetical protein [Myxococcota bacterium]